MLPFEIKKRRKPDSCDVSKCRSRGGLNKIEDDNKKYKVCDKHYAEWRAENSPVPGSPPAAAAPDGVTAVAMREASRGGSTTVVDKAPDGAIVPAQHEIIYSKNEILTAVEPVKAEAESNLAQLVGIVVTSQGALDAAGKLLQDVKGKIKALEAQRTSVTKPMLDAKKQIDAWFKPAKEALTNLETLLKDAIAKYVTEQEQARLAALQAGDHEGALATEQPSIPAGVQTRTVWKFEIVDESLIPREYLVVDAARIQQHVNIYKAQSTIPGITVYPDTGVSATATKV